MKQKDQVPFLFTYRYAGSAMERHSLPMDTMSVEQ